MEKELAKMRAGLTESVQLMEQREMNTNIEYAPYVKSDEGLLIESQQIRAAYLKSKCVTRGTAYRSRASSQ